jgi:hypothetical protein
MGLAIGRSNTTSANLEKKFDNGEEVIDYFDVASGIVRRPK